MLSLLKWAYDVQKRRMNLGESLGKNHFRFVKNSAKVDINDCSH